MRERRDLTPSGIERRESFERRKRREARRRLVWELTASFVLTALLGAAAAALAFLLATP